MTFVGFETSAPTWILLALAIAGCGSETSSPATPQTLEIPTSPAAQNRLGPDSDVDADREAARRRRSLIGCGRSHVCAITSSGNVECWGGNANGQSDAPEGRFTSLAVGERHSCGLRADGTIRCWGWNDYGQTDAPTGRFVSLLAEGWVSCGLREDMTIACWGNEDSGRTATPSGRFRDFAMADAHGVGLRADGALVPWGSSHFGDGGPPALSFTGVAVGGSATCGQRADGTLVCAGFGLNAQPAGLFSAIAGGQGVCALSASGEASCFAYDRMSRPPPAPSGPFTHIFAGRVGACALRPNGSAACWGRFQAQPPAGTVFDEIAVCEDQGCGHRVDGGVTCWGRRYMGQAQPPLGTFRSVVSGAFHSCALDAEGHVTCWGDDSAGALSAPPSSLTAGPRGDRRAGPFESLAAGDGLTCGLLAGGGFHCWGAVPNNIPQAWNDEPLASIVLGTHLGCGVSRSGGLRCFGGNAQGLDTSQVAGAVEVAVRDGHVRVLRADHTSQCFALVPNPEVRGPARGGDGEAPPVWSSVPCGEAQYRAIAATRDTICGLRVTDGIIECAERARDSETVHAPEAIAGGPYTSLSAGRDHACALDANGVAICWGGDAYGQSTPPSGENERYLSIAPGNAHTCAVRTDGQLRCWGSYAGTPL